MNKFTFKFNWHGIGRASQCCRRLGKIPLCLLQGCWKCWGGAELLIGEPATSAPKHSAWSSCERKTWSALSAKPNVCHSTCELFRCLWLPFELFPGLKAYLSRKLLVNRVTRWHPLAKPPKVYGHGWSCHVDYSKSFNPNISTTVLRPWGFNFPTFPNGVCVFFFSPRLASPSCI